MQPLAVPMESGLHRPFDFAQGRLFGPHRRGPQDDKLHYQLSPPPRGGHAPSARRTIAICPT